jgi:methyl-accepting chemotaxis protein
VGTIALVQNQNALTSQTEQNLSRILREKTVGYDAIFRRIEQEARGVAAYASMTYAAPVPRDDIGWRLLMPWTGSGYGNESLRRSLHDEILRMQRIGQVLKTTASNNPYLTLAYFATETSLTVFDQQNVVDVIEAINAFDPRQRPWYLQAKQANGSIWTDLYVDANTKKLTVTAATPVRDAENRLLGVVGFDVLLETLQSDILNIQIGYENEPFMINRQGTVIVRRGMDEENTAWDRAYKTDNLLTSANEGFRRIVTAMTGGASGIQSFTGDDGRQNYIAYAPVAAVNASLGIIVPRSEIVRPVRDNGKLVLFVMAIFVLISVGVGVWLGNQVSRPIQELTVMVDKASKGMLEVQEIPIRRRDEVGILAGAFNRMLSNLATVLKELEQRGEKKP